MKRRFKEDVIKRRKNFVLNTIIFTLVAVLIYAVTLKKNIHQKLSIRIIVVYLDNKLKN